MLDPFCHNVADPCAPIADPSLGNPVINDEPRSQCVVRSKVLANESLKAGKLKRHLTAKHSKYIDKPMSFICRLEKELSNQKKIMTKHLTILEKAQKAWHEVAYLIAKDIKPHSIGETLIKPVAIAISQIMNGDKVTEEIKRVLFADVSVK